MLYKTIIKVLGVVVIFCLGVTLGYTKGLSRGTKQLSVPTENPKTQVIVSDTTSVSVVPKTPDAPYDLINNNKYIAKINGKTYDVPVVTNELLSQNDNCIVVETKTDITPLVRKMVPNWEVGIGVGSEHGKLYVPLGLQRNYKVDKGLSFELHIDPKNGKVSGGSVMHKWMF